MFAYLSVIGSQRHTFLLTQILKTLKEKIRSKAKTLVCHAPVQQGCEAPHQCRKVSKDMAAKLWEGSRKSHR